MKNDQFKKVCHFVAGIILLPVAFKLFEQKKFIACLILLAAGLMFMFFAATYDWIEKSLGNITKLVFLLESLVFFFTAFLQLDAGRKKPTLVYAAAGVAYFLIFLYYLYGKEKSRKHKHKHRHHHHSNSNQHKHSDNNDTIKEVTN
ncbi:MAG: hypothetical protein MUE72_02795 [Chitinophagaceae bacterium]|jgi:Ca2+/Na+ antiporter|nr:hypothetical protein [Chitinophagaceae bacterium]